MGYYEREVVLCFPCFSDKHHLLAMQITNRLSSIVIAFRLGTCDLLKGILGDAYQGGEESRKLRWFPLRSPVSSPVLVYVIFTATLGDRNA